MAVRVTDSTVIGEAAITSHSFSKIPYQIPRDMEKTVPPISDCQKEIASHSFRVRSGANRFFMGVA